MNFYRPKKANPMTNKTHTARADELSQKAIGLANKWACGVNKTFEQAASDSIESAITEAYQRGLEDAAGIMTKRCADWSEQFDMASPPTGRGRTRFAARAAEAQEGAWAIRAMIEKPVKEGV